MASHLHPYCWIVISLLDEGRLGAIHGWVESKEFDKDRSFTRRARMKKYVKPSLKGLGLLRLVTKLSGDQKVCE